MSEAFRLLITAVEPSGDSLGAGLIRALRARLGADLELCGVGGTGLAAEGLVSDFDPSSMAVVGAFNALGVYPTVLRRVARIGRLAAQQQPHAAVLVDAWGFSLRAARAIRRASPHTRIIKYVAPQVWATRPGRARTLAGVVDHLLTIHTFDAPYFERAGLATTFVGQPALFRDLSPFSPDDFRRRHGLGEDPILLILPGSRRAEIARLGGVFGEAAARLKRRQPGLRLIVPLAQGVADQVRDAVRSWPSSPLLIEGEADKWAAMKAASAALACSGTVTTELAMAGCPMVVAYRLDPVTYQIARLLIRTPWVTVLNVAAGAEIISERLQAACTAPRLASDLEALLEDTPVRRRQIERQTAALDIMRGDAGDPHAAAAEAVLRAVGWTNAGPETQDAGPLRRRTGVGGT